MIYDIETCPRCGSEDLYRSRTRTPGERALRTLFPLHYYRCLGCGWRRPLMNSASWADWRSRIYRIAAPVLLGLLLAAGFLYLAFEGSRQVLRPRTPPEHTRKK